MTRCTGNYFNEYDDIRVGEKPIRLPSTVFYNTQSEWTEEVENALEIEYTHATDELSVLIINAEILDIV